MCHTPQLKHRLLQKPERSASTPGTESKDALQLINVGSYLQHRPLVTIPKSSELPRTETPQLRAAVKMRLQ